MPWKSSATLTESPSHRGVPHFTIGGFDSRIMASQRLSPTARSVADGTRPRMVRMSPEMMAFAARSPTSTSARFAMPTLPYRREIPHMASTIATIAPSITRAANAGF